MSFDIVQGDLFDPAFGFDGLAQGVNTYGVMGAGIAVPFRERWPGMFEDYKKLCTRYGPKLAGLLHSWHSYEDNITIFNMFSQDLPGKNGNYRWLEQSAIAMVREAERQDLVHVGLPWIGCGIAGLERHNVQRIFEEVFSSSYINFTLVQQ